MLLRTRIAPTPSGYLHLGNGASFLLTWCWCRLQQGRLVLRIDDLDTARFRSTYLEDIFATLTWLGIDYDEGPNGPADFMAHFSQVHRLPAYHDAINQLIASKEVYACSCSRKQRRERVALGHRRCACLAKGLALDRPQTALRLSVPDEAQVAIRDYRGEVVKVNVAEAIGDFVIRRKDGSPAYQITSVLDDEHWNINFIVRGKDLWASTAAQIYLAEKLNLSTFAETTFWHHALLLDEQNKKLSKSKDASALMHQRSAGESPTEVIGYVAEWMGLTDHGVPKSAQELLDLAKHIYIKKS